MEMTPEIIASEYRQAKSKLKQIGVLAELNDCTKDEIKQILIDQGEKLPGNMSAPGEKREKLPKEIHTQKPAPRPDPEPKEKNELAIYRMAIVTIGNIIFLSDLGNCNDIKEAVRSVLQMVFAAIEEM